MKILGFRLEMYNSRCDCDAKTIRQDNPHLLGGVKSIDSGINTLFVQSDSNPTKDELILFVPKEASKINDGLILLEHQVRIWIDKLKIFNNAHEIISPQYRKKLSQRRWFCHQISQKLIENS